MAERIEIGYEAFVADGGERVGAVRRVFPDAVVVYVENAGDFRIPREAIDDVHFNKIILNCGKLEPRLRQAIGHEHDAEVPDR